MTLQYMLVQVSIKDHKESSKRLTELAADGWRVQSITINGIALALVLLWREVK